MVEDAYGSDVVFWFDEHLYEWEFGIPETAERAEWYGVDSWPYVRIDGCMFYLGINTCEETAQIIGEMVDVRLAATSGLSPVSITGNFFADGSTVRHHATFELVDPPGLQNVRATFVVIEDEVENDYGEPFPRVTRSIHYEPVTLTSQGDVAYFEITLPQDPEWQTEMLSAVVFLQQTDGDCQIIQGAVLPLSSASNGDKPVLTTQATRIEYASPSPFRTMTEVVCHLTDTAAQGPVLLQVVDPLGRRVRELSLGTGVLSAGRRSVVWDGRSNGGEPVPEGTYFLRLITREGVAGGKAVLIR